MEIRWDCAGLSHWTPSAWGRRIAQKLEKHLAWGKFGGIMLYSLVVPCEHRSGGFRMIGAPQVRDMLWMGGSTPTGAFWVYGSFFRGWGWNAHFSWSKEAHWLWHKGSEPKYWVDDTKHDHMCIQVSYGFIWWFHGNPSLIYGLSMIIHGNHGALAFHVSSATRCPGGWRSRRRGVVPRKFPQLRAERGGEAGRDCMGMFDVWSCIFTQYNNTYNHSNNNHQHHNLIITI